MSSASPILATDKPWNSATTLYIARRLHEVSGGRPLDVLDVGCGDGTIISLLQEYGHRLHGYDLAYRNESLRRRLQPIFGEDFEQRVRLAPDERTIPFADDSFDVIYANQVFEHLRFFDQIVGECRRVLRPGGTLITLFPTATTPIEMHLRIPFAHWIPPGRVRQVYFWPWYALRIRPKTKGRSAWKTAQGWDRALASGTFYRFMNEIDAVFRHWFESYEADTSGHIRAKIDLLRTRRSRLRRALGVTLNLIDGRLFTWLVANAIGAVFVVRNPRKGEIGVAAPDESGVRLH
jgi:SAM-dependent methyltransferase